MYVTPVSAAGAVLAGDAHCVNPWSYKFSFDGQNTTIEHCGRTDSGRLDYLIKSSAAGKLVIYHDGPRTTLRIKVAGRSYTQVVEGKGEWQSDIQVKEGEEVSFLADMGDQPFSGWTSPKDQACMGFSGVYGSMPVGSLYGAVAEDNNVLISAQCWGDGYRYESFLKENNAKPTTTITCNGSNKDCHDVLIEDMDFNDGAYFLAINPRIEHQSACTDLNITSGNGSRIPAKVSFEAKAEDNLGAIQGYRFLFGDGSKIETDHNTVDHTYESSGRFEAVVEAKNSKGEWMRSDACEAIVRVEPSNIESHRSDCSYLRIVSGQNSQAPALVVFRIAGYDNKGNVKAYRLDFGDGTSVEANEGRFEHRYERSGTYKAKASIKDSKDNWQEDTGCEQTVYVSTKPIQEQPETGAPTWLTVMGLGGGALAFSYPFMRGTQAMNRSHTTSRSKKRRS